MWSRGPTTKAALVWSAAALALAGCGGGSESNTGQAGGDAIGVADDDDAPADADEPAQESGGLDTAGVAFDAAALGTEPLDRADLRIAQAGGAAAPAVSPVIDTCAALPASELDVLANAAAERYSLGEQHTFVAETAGAACRYRSDTHSVLVVVGSVDAVNVGTASVVVPVSAGDISEFAWTDDPSITILSENSFGVDTPFAAFATAGPYGVAVSNGGGTGIDYSSEGVLFAEVAAAVAARTDDAPAPADGTPSGAASGDPCTVWSVDEIDAFFRDASIGANDDVTISNGCVWSAEDGGTQVRLTLLDPAEAATLAVAPVVSGSAVLEYQLGGDEVLVVTGDAALQLTVEVFDPETLTYVDTRDAAIALAENLATRIGI